jgi:hypothetical protein
VVDDAGLLAVMDEWHLVLANSFEYGQFSLVPGQFEFGVSLRSSLPISRLESVRSISDAMKCDGLQQLLVKGVSEGRATSLKVDQRMKRFQRLQRPFEADRSRLDSALCRRLGHDRADEIVGEHVRPDLLMDKFRRLAS